jgi:hypothetical protein
MCLLPEELSTVTDRTFDAMLDDLRSEINENV